MSAIWYACVLFCTDHVVYISNYLCIYLYLFSVCFSVMSNTISIVGPLLQACLQSITSACCRPINDISQSSLCSVDVRSVAAVVTQVPWCRRRREPSLRCWTCNQLTHSRCIARLLHWLPGGHRITYKLCPTTWKTFHTSQPLYLSELISHYLPPRSLRSSNTNLLTRPAGITSNFSSWAFCVSAPSTWNGTLYLHTFVLSTPYPPKFHLFQSAFTVLSSSASDSFSRFLAPCKFVCMCLYSNMVHSAK